MAALVSIVIPTYNHANFIGRALRSVVDQTYNDWEALVIDNCSQDNTDEIVKSFDDSRIRLLKINNSGVIAASRNMGMREARGKWIAFLDSDDCWYPTKLERCVAHLSKGLDLVCHGERWVADRRMRSVFYGPNRRASYKSLLFDGNCFSTSAVVVGRERVAEVGGFREDHDIITAEDYDLWMRLARNGIKIEFVSEILGECHLHGGNESRVVQRSMDALLRVVQWHVAQIKDRSLIQRLRIRRRDAIIYYSGARGFQNAGQYRKAWPYLMHALKRWPLMVKFYIALIYNGFRLCII